MNTCGDGHDEICFIGRTCPLCVAKAELKGYEDEIAEMRENLKEIREELENAM